MVDRIDEFQATLICGDRPLELLDLLQLRSSKHLIINGSICHTAFQDLALQLAPKYGLPADTNGRYWINDNGDIIRLAYKPNNVVPLHF